MANTFTAVVDKIFSEGLLALREAAQTPRLINTNWGTEVAQQGDTIDVPLPGAMTVGNVAPAQVPIAGQDITRTTVQIALDQWKQTETHMTDKEAHEVASGNMPFDRSQASEAIKALGNNIDNAVLALGADAYGYTGTAATAPFASDLSDARAARRILSDQLAPESPRHFVGDPTAIESALGNRAIQDASFRAANQDTLVTGEIGNVLGFAWHENQNVPLHTNTGTGTVVVNDASTAIGDTTITWDGGGTAPAAGDVFTVAGDTQTYVVVSSTATVITMLPTLQVAVADNAAITFKATHRNNLAFHRDAFALAIRPATPAGGFSGGNIIRSDTDPNTGVSLTLEISRQHHRNAWTWSVLYGVKTIRRELAMRVAG